MELSELKPNAKNPRKISPSKLKQLEKALKEFGDLSGIVFNRKSGQLVGGHMRLELFRMQDARVEITEQYKKPTKTGTVAEGFVMLGKEKFAYREVSWDIGKEKAANIAANKGAGQWDDDLLADWMNDLADLNFDLDLTMFDEKERLDFFEDDEPKPKKGKKENEGRVSSSAVKQFQLTFTEENADEFVKLVEHFQVSMNVDSVSDTVLEVLRLARDAAESE